MQYIKIPDNRLRHMRAVAELCYSISLERGFSKDYAMAMYVVGFNHDIGYAFSNNPANHEEIGAKVLGLAFSNTNFMFLNAIKNHGKSLTHCSDEYKKKHYISSEWAILCEADLKVDNKGNKITVKERLEDIKRRYGEESNNFKTAKEIATQLNILDK